MSESTSEEIARLKKRLAELEANHPPTQNLVERADQKRGSANKLGQIIGLSCVALIGMAAVMYAFGGMVGKPALAPANTTVESQPPRSLPEDAATPRTEAVVNQTTVEPAATPWTYSETVDKLTDQKTKFACTTSINQVQLNPPYSNVAAQLCIRRAPRSGLNVYVALEGDGQILCTSYDGCTVHARFDDHPLQAVSASGAADNSSNVIFLNGQARLVSSLQRSSKTLIELSFYEAGDQTIEFNTAGLEWDAPAAKK